jgi:hypothetical protein
MRRQLAVAGVIVLVLIMPLNAADPMKAFADEWKGATVVLKKPLYTFVFTGNALALLQPVQSHGVTGIAPDKGIYYLFTALKPTVHTMVDTDVQRLAERARADAGYTTTFTHTPTGQSARQNHAAPLLAVITSEAGTELVVKQIIYGGGADHILKVELTSPRAPTGQLVTRLFVEWPGPFSREFAERPKVEELMGEFFERVKR